MFVIGASGFEERLGSDLFFVTVAVGGRFIGLDCLVEGIDAVEEAYLFFACGADVHLRARRDRAIGTVFDELFIHSHGFVHGRKERYDTPELEPLAGQVTIGNFELAAENLLVAFDLGVFLEQLLIFFEGALILMLLLETTPQKVLRRRGIVGKRPHFDRPPRRPESGRVVLVFKSRLRDFELIFGPGANPFAAAD